MVPAAISKLLSMRTIGCVPGNVLGTDAVIATQSIKPGKWGEYLLNRGQPPIMLVAGPTFNLQVPSEAACVAHV